MVSCFLIFSLQRWSLFPCSLNPYWPCDFLWCGELSRDIFVQVSTCGFYFGSEIASPIAQAILLDQGSTNFICKEPDMLVGERKLKVESFEIKLIFRLFYSTLYRFLKSSGVWFGHRFLHCSPKICPIRLCPQHHVSRWTVLLNPVSNSPPFHSQREKNTLIHHLTENWDY